MELLAGQSALAYYTAIKERSNALRRSLVQDMGLIGLVENGDSLAAEHLGVYNETVLHIKYF